MRIGILGIAVLGGLLCGHATAADVVPQTGPYMMASALDFSPDGRLLAVGGGHGFGSMAGEVILLDAANGETLRALPAQLGEVSLVQFLDGGKTLLTATTESHGAPADGVMRLWDVATGTPVRELSPPHRTGAVAVSSNGQWMAWAEPHSHSMHAESHERLTLEFLPSGRRSALKTDGIATQLAFSADGRSLFAITEKGPRLWNCETGTPKSAAAPQLERAASKPGGLPPRPVTLLALAPNGTDWAGIAQGGVGVWDIATGKRHGWLPLAEEASAAAFFDGGRQLAVRAGAAIHLWKLAGAVAQQVPVPRAMIPRQGRAMAVTPDGKSLAAFAIRWSEREMQTREMIYEIHLLSLPDGKTRRVVTSRQNPPKSVAFSPDGSTIYSTWHDTGVRYWDARTGALKSNSSTAVGANWKMAVSSDGTMMARSGGLSAPRNLVTVTSADGGTELKLKTNSDYPAETLVFGPGNKTIAVNSGREIALRELPSGRLLRTFPAGGSHISSAAFSPDGKQLLICGGHNNSMELWSLIDGELLGRFIHINLSPKSAVFSPNGRFVVSVDSRQVILWDVATQTALYKWPMEGIQPLSAAFSPDGATLAVAENFAVRFYDVKNPPNAKTALRDGPKVGGAPLRTFTSPRGVVNGIAFSPDAATLASACGDGAIYLFNAATGQQRAQLRVLPPARDGEISGEWVALTTDGYFNGSPNAAAFLRWRDGEKWLTDATGFQSVERVKQALAP